MRGNSGFDCIGDVCCAFFFSSGMRQSFAEVWPARTHPMRVNTDPAMLQIAAHLRNLRENVEPELPAASLITNGSGPESMPPVRVIHPLTPHFKGELMIGSRLSSK